MGQNVFRIRTLGGLDIVDFRGKTVNSVLVQPKRTAILIYVALANPVRFVKRDLLLAMFWPEQDAQRARNSLRQALFGLRQDLGQNSIQTRADDSVAIAEDYVSCDVHGFDSSRAARDYEKAADLYAGPFLNGFALTQHTEFNQWAEAERDRLAHDYSSVLEQLVEAAARNCDWREAVKWCRMLTKHNPYSSRVALKHMEALAAAGDRAAAIKRGESHASRLAEELEAAPSPDVEQFAERLRKAPKNRMHRFDSEDGA